MILFEAMKKGRKELRVKFYVHKKEERNFSHNIDMGVHRHGGFHRNVMHRGAGGCNGNHVTLRVMCAATCCN